MPAISRRTFLVATASTLGLACRVGGTPVGPLMAPSELARRMDDVKSGKLAVLYVGPAPMFELGHVPGAQNIGPAGEDDGRRALERALAALPAASEVVLYCGCCPVANCPNVRPASEVIAQLGRKSAYVLDLPTRFSTDWINRGYPVEPR